jgi:hypothetical protein
MHAQVSLRRHRGPPGGGMSEKREGVELVRLPYVRPALVVLGTVQDLTRAGTAGQDDAAGFGELGGS